MAVGAAWRNKLFCGIVAAFSALGSPAFAGADCELLSRGPGVDLQKSEVTLHSFLDEFMTSLRTSKFSTFHQFFHPRAKTPKDIGDKLEAILDNRYNKPWQFSVFRVWRIKSPEGSKALLDSCPDSDGAKVISSFGYDRQFAVWIQIMGQNELGRIILSVAPDKAKMSIVGFRIQQWTQLGDDWQTWTQKAEKAQTPLEAYFALDIAQKLLEGQDFVIYPQQAALIESRDKLFTQESLVKKLNGDLKVDSIAYIGSMMTREETGIILREFVSPDEPTQKLNDLCFKRGKELLTLGWLQAKQSLRCNFLVKGMDPRRDSPLGGLLFTSADLHKVQK